MKNFHSRGRRITQRLSFKLLFSVTIILLVYTLVLTGLNVINERRQAEEVELRDLNALYTNYSLDVAELEDEAAALAISIADRPDVRERLVRGDRAALLTLLTPVFNQLKSDYHIVHLYVENPDGTVFLRVHNPSQFGDSVTYRHTAATVLNSKEAVAGVEIGPSRLGVRGVAPIFDGATFVGMVEVGVDFDTPFVEGLKTTSGADYLIWITNDAAAPAGLKPVEGALASPSEDFFYYAGTRAEALPIPEEVYLDVLNSGNPQLQYVTSGDQPYVALIQPLKGYGDRTIGLIEIVSSRQEFLTDVQEDTRFAFLIAGIVSVLGLAGIWVVSQIQILRPVSELAATARKQLAGDLSARANLRKTDEFGDLATTLNSLSQNLQDTIGSLESRVAERTNELAQASAHSEQRAKQLEAVMQVARATATIDTLEVLLPRVTQLINQQFGFYHVGIFFLDDNREYAVLMAANSEGGKRMLAREHKLKLGQTGIVGFVGATGTPRIALDVGADAVYFDNPDLPKTRSEIALPMFYAKQMIGVLDVQSTEPDAFALEDVEVLSALANQVAVAIQNAISLQETRKLLAEARTAVSSYITESWKILQPLKQAAGYEKVGTSLRQLERPLEGEHVRQATETGETIVTAGCLAVPLRLRGQVIGVLNMQIPQGRHWSTEEVDIAEGVAERLSLAIETSVLLQATQRRANIERITADISGKISSSTRLETILQSAAQELSRALGGSDVLVQIEPVALKMSSTY